MLLKERYKGCGVYKITSPTGRFYIGSSVNIYNRFYQYKKGNISKQLILKRSFDKYGVENHSFEILIKCNQNERFSYERYLGDLYGSIQERGGLNLRLPSSNEMPPICSNELRNKFSIIASNRKYSKETIEKFKNARLGKYANGDHPLAKLIINTETGIFYSCVKEAAKSIGMKRSTLSMKLTGRNINNTSFIYA